MSAWLLHKSKPVNDRPCRKCASVDRYHDGHCKTCAGRRALKRADDIRGYPSPRYVKSTLKDREAS